MNVEGLSRELESSIRSGATLREAPRISTGVLPTTEYVEVSPEALSSLLEFMKADPALSSLEGQVLWDGHSGVVLKLFGLAHALLEQAIRVGPTSAASNLARFIAGDSAPGLAIMALRGVSVERRLLLGRGAALMPTKDLAGFDHRWQSMISGGHPPYFDIPDTALVLRSRVRPKLLPQGQSPKKPAEWYARLKEISLWLTVVGPCSPVEVMTWWQMDDWIPMPSSALGWMVPFPLRSIPAVRITGALRDEARDTFAMLAAASDERRARLRVPLERLNSAVREDHLVDRLIELGIALESLLLEENERNEITFRLSLRGGWLLGRDAGERRQIVDTLKTLYGYRSTAVHRGAVVRRKGKPEPADVLKQGLSLAARATKIIATRGFPDWTTLVVGSEAWTDFGQT